jgi:hypothetical protein
VGLIEKLDVYITERLDAVVRGSKGEDTWKVVGQVVQHFFVFGD